jgi:hypothetical protein
VIQAIDAIQAIGPKNHMSPYAQDANASIPTAYEADE